MAPMLSVIVPFYGVEAYLAECIESIQAQTLRDLEIVLVDDGSPDASIDIARRYARTDQRIHVVQQMNQGLGPARNTGVRHSTGKYLTFVDSDDVIPPRAFELMVSTLERTGSSFAGGDARRFSTEKGVTESWTHKAPFEFDRLATHITRFPELIRDRMIWNKVYRRSFWDAGGYEFPAIRYEDYPVTLKAHLEAKSVDVLADVVYYWRDRDSGDSITQQVFKADNVRDRVHSAHLVLDLLHDVDDEIRLAVHDYFIEVDLVALAGALASAPQENQKELEMLAVGLARRLDKRADQRAPRLARLVHSGLMAGDFALVRGLGTWRAGGDLKTLLQTVAKGPRLGQLPRVVNAVVPRKKIPLPGKTRWLRVALEELAWDGSVLRLSGLALLRPEVAARASLRLRLEGPAQPQLLPIETRPASNGVRFEARVSTATVLRMQHHPGELKFWLRLSVGPLIWRGHLVVGELALPGARGFAGRWVQPFRQERRDALMLEVLPDVPVVEAAAVDGGVLTLTVNTSLPPHGEVVVVRPAPSAAVALPTNGTEVTLDLGRVLAGDPPDDPVARVAVRPIRLRLENDERFDQPLFLAAEPVTATRDGRAVSLTRGDDGALVLRSEPAGA